MQIRSAAFVLALACLAASSAPASEKPAVRSYTNADLERIAPRRGETGVLSTPAVTPSDDPAPRAPSVPRHDETYWRREAERLHDRLRSLRQRADEVRVKLAQPPRRTEGRRPSTASDPTPALKARLTALEAEIRDRQDRFDERARREGALPGWLR
jgi:hypothetical protein